MAIEGTVFFEAHCLCNKYISNVAYNDVEAYCNYVGLYMLHYRTRDTPIYIVV